jgi:hypothetical protein
MYQFFKELLHCISYEYTKRSVNPKLNFQEGGYIDTLILIDRLEVRSGGVRNIARITQGLTSDIFGKKLVYIQNPSKDDEKIFLDYGFDCDLTYEAPKKFKNLITGSWTFSHIVYEMQNLNQDFIWTHIIQDFDEYFFPISTRNYFSRNARIYPNRFIVSGMWMKFDKPSINLPFPVDYELYKNYNSERDIDVIMFHKPEMPRRCAYLLEIIANELLKNNPHIKIGCYGSNLSKYIFRNKRVIHFGAPTKLSSLVEIYNRVKIGISMNTTNPSLIPFEQAACGCQPLSPSYYAENKFNLNMIHVGNSISEFIEYINNALIYDKTCERANEILNYYKNNNMICNSKEFQLIINKELELFKN